MSVIVVLLKISETLQAKFSLMAHPVEGRVLNKE